MFNSIAYMTFQPSSGVLTHHTKNNELLRNHQVYDIKDEPFLHLTFKSKHFPPPQPMPHLSDMMRHP